MAEIPDLVQLADLLDDIPHAMGEKARARLVEFEPELEVSDTVR